MRYQFKSRKNPRKPNVFKPKNRKPGEKPPRKENPFSIPATEQEWMAIPRERFVKSLSACSAITGINSVLPIARKKMRSVQMFPKERELFEQICNRLGELQNDPDAKAETKRLVKGFWTLLDQFS